MVTFIGIVGAADRQVPPTIGIEPGTNAPIYHWPDPFGFFIAVEFKPGMSHRPVGKVVFSSPDVLADFQIKSDMDLGTPTLDVCDTGPPGSPKSGGVPADTMPGFGGSDLAVRAINDLSCRFDVRQTSSEACTHNAQGQGQFKMLGASTIQFCGAVDSLIAFPAHARTRITVRARDDVRQPGPEQSMIVEIE